MDAEDPIKSAEENEHPPFTAGTITREVKLLAQEILKNGFIENATDAPGFNSVVRNHQNINAVLEPLDLRVDLDELRGLAVVCVSESVAVDADEAWSHPLVRRQRLTLEQSLLVAILRQFYVVQEMESGIGVREVRVSLDELRSPLQVFLADTGSDAKNHQRLLTLLDQLKPHGIVSEPDSRGEIIVRPLITRLANPATLTMLLQHFRELSKQPAKVASPPVNE
jgi:hypothetical protein